MSDSIEKKYMTVEAKELRRKKERKKIKKKRRKKVFDKKILVIYVSVSRSL